MKKKRKSAVKNTGFGPMSSRCQHAGLNPEGFLIGNIVLPTVMGNIYISSLPTTKAVVAEPTTWCNGTVEVCTIAAFHTS